MERWRVSKFSKDELESGIDMETVLPRKKINKVVFYEQKPSGDYNRVVERDNYKEPEAYAEIVNAE